MTLRTTVTVHCPERYQSHLSHVTLWHCVHRLLTVGGVSAALRASGKTMYPVQDSQGRQRVTCLPSEGRQPQCKECKREAAMALHQEGNERRRTSEYLICNICEKETPATAMSAGRGMLQRYAKQRYATDPQYNQMHKRMSVRPSKETTSHSRQ